MSRERVHARTRQLALLAGRVPPQVSQTDYEQAKREITSETEPDRQNAALDATFCDGAKPNFANLPALISASHPRPYLQGV